jgi:hypothetical protein
MHDASARMGMGGFIPRKIAMKISAEPLALSFRHFPTLVKAP